MIMTKLSWGLGIGHSHAPCSQNLLPYTGITPSYQLPQVGPGTGMATHELILWYTYVNSSSGILLNEINGWAKRVIIRAQEKDLRFNNRFPFTSSLKFQLKVSAANRSNANKIARNGN